jgi:hypothetical protein
MKSASFISAETEWRKPQEPLILATGYWLLAPSSLTLNAISPAPSRS